MVKKTKKDNGLLFEMKAEDELLARKKPLVHQYSKNKIVCSTDKLGYARPDGRSPAELRVDTSEGFIPLWEKGSILRWKFSEDSLAVFKHSSKIKKRLRKLMSNGLSAWGDFLPVKFSENEDASDFEIVVRESDKCSILGCTLASAFFPDSGQHQLVIYPQLFEQSEDEQVETMAHELGHIFGLRHFFAEIEEKQWPSELFGANDKFTIMNYGEESILTSTDQDDLKALYTAVWNGQLTEINGTPIRLFKPYHTFA